jgi:hypothetical protein
MSLPILYTSDRTINNLQTLWAASLNPLLVNPLNNANSIDVHLVSGPNVINHKLGRVPQGWFTCDLDANVAIYRSAPFNNLTLTLTSSGASNIKLVVF